MLVSRRGRAGDINRYSQHVHRLRVMSLAKEGEKSLREKKERDDMWGGQSGRVGMRWPVPILTL